MAVRLNVVMIHSPPAVAGAQALAESVVGELIGRPGIDVTLVGSLDNVAPNSTDALTLESLTGDVAVLDWRTPVQLIDKLKTIDFLGYRTPHADDLSSPTPANGQRKIYAFDLNQISDAKRLCTSLQDLLASRKVKTVSIGGFSTATTQQPAAAGPETSSQKTSASPPKTGSNGRVSSPPSSTLPKVDAPGNSSPELPPATRPVSQPASIDLDDLVDQLDQFDP